MADHQDSVERDSGLVAFSSYATKIKNYVLLCLVLLNKNVAK